MQTRKIDARVTCQTKFFKLSIFLLLLVHFTNLLLHVALDLKKTLIQQFLFSPIITGWFPSIENLSKRFNYAKSNFSRFLFTNFKKRANRIKSTDDWTYWNYMEGGEIIRKGFILRKIRDWFWKGISSRDESVRETSNIEQFSRWM